MLHCGATGSRLGPWKDTGASICRCSADPRGTNSHWLLRAGQDESGWHWPCPPVLLVIPAGNLVHPDPYCPSPSLPEGLQKPDPYYRNDSYMNPGPLENHHREKRFPGSARLSCIHERCVHRLFHVLMASEQEELSEKVGWTLPPFNQTSTALFSSARSELTVCALLTV